jgi:type III secretory pathway component EscV
MSPEMTVKRMLTLHYKAMCESITMPYGTGFRIHLRSILDRIGVLNTKQIQSEQLKIEINNALIESSAAIDLTRLQELVQKLSPESASTRSIVKLQDLLERWWTEKKHSQSTDHIKQQLIQQFDQVIDDVQAVGDEDIRHRIEISVNNIRSSMCHIQQAERQPSIPLLGA